MNIAPSAFQNQEKNIFKTRALHSKPLPKRSKALFKQRSSPSLTWVLKSNLTAQVSWARLTVQSICLSEDSSRAVCAGTSFPFPIKFNDEYSLNKPFNTHVIEEGGIHLIHARFWWEIMLL